jgi:hypothetical protein
MSTFDPATFLDMPITEEQAPRPPITPGDYTAVIKEVTSEPWQSKDKVDENGRLKSGMKYNVILTVEVPEAERERTGLSFPTLELRDGIMLELNAQGGIDTGKGKNDKLRRYREALDMNKAGVTFRASQMAGKALTVRIGHTEWPVGSGNLREEVKGVARLA